MAQAIEEEQEKKAKEAEKAGQKNGGGRDDKPKPQIWLLDPVAGDEPRQLTWREEGVKQFDWSPDGQRVAFTSKLEPEKA